MDPFGVKKVNGTRYLVSGICARKLADPILVERCGEQMNFEGVTYTHRYLSMISLTNRITGGSMTPSPLG